MEATIICSCGQVRVTIGYKENVNGTVHRHGAPCYDVGQHHAVRDGSRKNQLKG